jgi:tight adherence protein C
MQLQIAVIIGIGILIVGIILAILSLSWSRREDFSHRLQTYVIDSDSQNRSLEASLMARNMELQGSFSERTLYPLLRRLARLTGALLPARRATALDRKLSVARNPMGLRAREFYGLQLAVALLGGLLAILIYIQDFQYGFLFSLMIFLVSLILPVVWLNRKVQFRKNQIRKELPDVIDMLSVCTSAGLSFDQSLQRVSQEWKTQMSWELGRVVSEMEMGFTRRDALRNLANRLDVSELSSFVSIIIQSDQLGMSISDTLHSLAGQMRIEWRFKAQEEARKVPVKILIPLVFLIFPAMLAVIMGPSIPALLDMFEIVQ